MMTSEERNIVAIVLAAGQSKRMGAAKLLLPWGETTVLGQILKVISSTDSITDEWIRETIVITGGWRAEVEAEVARLAEKYPVRAAFNTEYENGEMLSSLRVGLRAANELAAAALIALGDQPQVQSRTVQNILQRFEEAEGHIVIPSYRNRRGHPILMPRKFWDELLGLKTGLTLRDFLNAHAAEIVYVDADESVLQDLDTPEDYQRANPISS